MSLVETIHSTPDAIRFFLEPMLQKAPDFISQFTSSLSKEQTLNFNTVNRFLESQLGNSHQILDEFNALQAKLEEADGYTATIERQYEELKVKGQSALMELHRGKIKFNDLKISLCRFIIYMETPNRNGVKNFSNVEEWNDAATLAEMRLTRKLEVDSDKALQKFLALFMTFRSIVCSYHGPADSIRQIESALASLDAIYDKNKLEVEVHKAAQRLAETRKELSTVKINLNSLQTQLAEKKNQAEQLTKLMHLQEKPSYGRIFIALFIVFLVLGALAFNFWGDLKTQRKKWSLPVGPQACKDIALQLQKSPRYQSQVLIFRKYNQDVYFKASAETCEKMYRLDSLQITSLAHVLQDDYTQGHQDFATFRGNRVLQVKEIGLNKLVVKLANHTEEDIHYKLKILEHATLLRAVLQADKENNTEDLLIVDLNNKTQVTE